MSSYISVQGYFVFLNEKKYTEVRNKLIAGGWLNEAGDILNEDASIIEKKVAPPPLVNTIKFIKELEEIKYIIKIPISCYRNLSPARIAVGSDYFWYIWSCTDGDLSGGTFKHNTVSTNVNLETWAENKIEKVFNSEGYLENYSEIASEFLDEQSESLLDFKIIKDATFYPKVKSIKGEEVIGEYKDSYLVDTPTETTLVKKKLLGKPLKKGKQNERSKKKTKKLTTNRKRI